MPGSLELALVLGLGTWNLGRRSPDAVLASRLVELDAVRLVAHRRTHHQADCWDRRTSQISDREGRRSADAAGINGPCQSP